MSDVFVKIGQLETTATDILNKVKNKGYLTEVDDYTITKQGTAEEGYAATYQLLKGETAVGAKINIPKDMVVQSGTVETVTQADTPYSGAKVGDKYIDLVLANATSNHIYIPVNDLIDVYTAGNGIDVSNNAIAIKVDAANARGLSVSASGLGLAAAVASTSGTGGSDGAMTAADKEKLDNADVTPYTAGNGIAVSGHAVSGIVDANNANGLAVGASGFSLAAATTSAAGAMSAGDKTKLDNIVAATDAEIQTMIAGLPTL